MPALANHKGGASAQGGAQSCPDSVHDWTHCPLFPLLLSTLVRMARIMWLLKASIAEHSQAGRMVLSPLVTLGKLFPWGHLVSLSIFQKCETPHPPQAVWGFRGHCGKCLTPEDQEMPSDVKLTAPGWNSDILV